MICGEALELPLFPAEEGGASPTSPLQIKFVEIDKGVAASLYRKHHYLGDKGFLHQYTYGGLWHGEVICAITYGIPNAHSINGLYDKHNQHGVLEITRLVCDPRCPKNTPSRMIAITTRLLKKIYPLKLLISYADTAQGHDGGIYKASNFRAHGLTAKKTDFKFPDGSIRKGRGIKYSELEGEWVPRSQKYLFSKKIEDDRFPPTGN